MWSVGPHPTALRSTHSAVNLSLHEPWLRKHQVLPGRTHPTMTTMAGTGGYVLSGTYIPPWAHGKRPEGGAGGGGGGGGGGRDGGGGGKRARTE